MYERVRRDRLHDIVYRRLEDLDEHVEIDEVALRNFLKRVRENQNLMLAILTGTAAALAGAVLWGFIAAALERHVAFFALGLGALVGLTVRKFGQGFDRVFGIAGGILAAGGCVAGLLFTVLVFTSRALGISLFDVLGNLGFREYRMIWAETVQPVHFIFYILAIYEGYRFSIKRISNAELRSFTSK
jgi:hypothetical protein